VQRLVDLGARFYWYKRNVYRISTHFHIKMSKLTPHQNTNNLDLSNNIRFRDNNVENK